MAVDVVLFVSKRLMPVAAVLLLLGSARLADRLKPGPPASPTGEVRVMIGR